MTRPLAAPGTKHAGDGMGGKGIGTGDAEHLKELLRNVGGCVWGFSEFALAGIPRLLHSLRVTQARGFSPPGGNLRSRLHCLAACHCLAVTFFLLKP